MLKKFFKLNRKRQTNKYFWYKLAWRFFVVFFVISFLVLGVSPKHIYQAYLAAQNENIETLNFYAGNSISLNQENNYDSGWWNMKKSLGKASLNEEADLINFSDTNSAFYAGGDDSLVLSNWEIGEDMEIKQALTIEEISTSEEAIEVVPIDFEEVILNSSSSVGIATGSDLIISDKDVSSTSAEVGNYESEITNQEFSTSTEADIEIVDQAEEVDKVEIVDEDSVEEIVVDDVVEDLEEAEEDINNAEAEEVAGEEINTPPSSAEATDSKPNPSEEQDVENSVDSNEGVDISVEEDIISRFKVQSAVAQDDDPENINSFSELGELKSASINISLAVFMYEGLDVDVESESKVDVAVETIGTGTSEKLEIGNLKLNNDASSSYVEIDNQGERVGSSSEENIVTDEVEELDQNAINTTPSAAEATDGKPDSLDDSSEEDVQNDLVKDEEVVIEEIVEEQLEEVVIEEVEVIDPSTSSRQESGQAGQGVEEVIPEEVNTSPFPLLIEGGLDEPVSDNETVDEISWFEFVKIARAQGGGEAVLEVWYSVDPVDENSSSTNQYWERLTVFAGSKLSNALNGGYYNYPAEFIADWEDLENLRLKFVGKLSIESKAIVYLDSAWVETEFEPSAKYKRLTTKGIWDGVIEQISAENTFSALSNGSLKFRYNPVNTSIWSEIVDIITTKSLWEKVDIEAKLLNSKREIVDIPLMILFEEENIFTVKFGEDRKEIKPGKYYIEFTINDEERDEEQSFTFNQEFSWGVLAMNFNKSEYSVGDKGDIQIAVLDENGHTVCDAQIDLLIVNPSGVITNFKSSDNDIVYSENCGPETITNIPDYSAEYYFDQAGEYEVTLSATTKSGTKTVTEKVSASRNAFHLERFASTRIFPKADYKMKMIAKFGEDFKGNITEAVPAGFKITDYKLAIINSTSSDPFGGNYKYQVIDNEVGREIVWQGVEASAGDELLIEYTFDAPDISPELYLLGPADLTSSENGASETGSFTALRSVQDDSFVFQEARAWQIASDAVNKRARTIMLAGGTYDGNDTTGGNTNTSYTFDRFNFQIAETEVEIKNAYLMFEAQFEAYGNGGGNYSGYKLYFDSCEEACTADALGSSGGQVSINNNNYLAYDENESNQVRLLFDVTNEAGLQGYTGGGAEMEAQIGYQIKNASVYNSIANAQAVLFITYEYDSDSENITNTVIYPLDSTNGTDSGTRQSSQSSCTPDDNCPTFSYNMELPELSGIATGTNLVSQWFKFYDHNDSNSSSDINPYIDVEGYNYDSDARHFNSSNGGTQGNMPGFIYPKWIDSGFAENAAQEVEYYVDAGSNYMVGGEVFETYIASSSAATSTRTVSFPLGVLTNGNDTALNFKGVDVYLPENGSATGTVDIKSAWFRVKSHHFNSGNFNIIINTKVGGNATTSSDLTYAYNGGNTVKTPLLDIIHIIPSTDYGALEEANNDSAVEVRLAATQSDVSYGGLSAELMITYSYTSEQKGYLTSLNLFGGQSLEDPLIATTVLTAKSVMPENSGKTVYAGGLKAHFFNSDSSGDVPGGSLFLLDANLSTSSNPSCAPQYRAKPDDINSNTEMVKDVADAINTVDGQQYYACYSDEENSALITTEGAVMGGQLVYTYGWENSAPSSTILSALQKTDGSNIVDISILADDIDNHEIRAKLEYATGTACSFVSSGDPHLDEADSNITAVYQDPDIVNNNEYQIGSDSAFITTASGTNTVHFDWLTQNLGAVEGDYCLQLTSNDTFIDQSPVATKTVYLDLKKPTAPGALNLNSRTGTTLTLNYGATSTETNFDEYIIYYKVADGTAPDENDSVWASTSDANLYDQLFNSEATTTITGLTASTSYSIAIWVYDTYGNKASSSYVNIVTNDAPITSFNSAVQRTDGSGIVDISVEVDDNNNQDYIVAKLEYESGSACSFGSPEDPSLSESPLNILADFGSPVIDNYSVYQIGSTTAYILTSPGSNTIEFDWLAYIDEDTADDTYCLRLTANDTFDDTLKPGTTTLVLDNTDPVSTGNLSADTITTDSIRLVYASTSPATDTNEPTTNAYKIFYKEGTSGVTTGDTEIDNADLNTYDYNSATSTLVSGLTQNTFYTFNIWTYDTYGNVATATEVTFQTAATVNNVSLTFTNAVSDGPNTNIAVADGQSEYIFRAVVSETNGWPVLASTTLRLADNADNTEPYNDLAFYWDQSTDSFFESGGDANAAAVLSTNSTSSCAAITCTLDFHIIFNKTFETNSTDYTASLYTGNDSYLTDIDHYVNLYEVRFNMVNQNHYRWRNDDGGE